MVKGVPTSVVAVAATFGVCFIWNMYTQVVTLVCKYGGVGCVSLCIVGRIPSMFIILKAICIHAAALIMLHSQAIYMYMYISSTYHSS